MHGRKFPRLLAALAFILLALSFLYSQSDSRQSRATAAPDFAFQPPTIRPTPRPTPPVPQATGALGLPQLAGSAGTIFSGTVTSVARKPAAAGHGIETVAVTLHVENAIRGATPGTDFTFLQWIGAWSAGQRYRVGERMLLFLYPPSKLGLTSCVAAPVGRFSINGSGRVSLTAQQVAACRSDPVLGGKSRVSFSDFVLAVQQATQTPATRARVGE